VPHGDGVRHTDTEYNVAFNRDGLVLYRRPHWDKRQVLPAAAAWPGVYSRHGAIALNPNKSAEGNLSRMGL
jgi:hypothetical protein